MFALTFGACSKSEPAPQANPTPPAAPSPVPATAQVTLTAPEIFKTRCAACHGESGKGDGPAAVSLNPKPRDYSDPEWQKATTDEMIKKTIVEGGQAVGKSPLMVPNPDLAGKTEVLDGLVTIIRGFAPKPTP
jgi:mono/diheme cytochrome c family protein